MALIHHEDHSERASRSEVDHDHTTHDHNHSHGHSHSHSHAHPVPVDGKGRVGLIFRLSLIATLLFMLIEVGAGIWANSLALISDGGHNLTDAMALAFSWWALTMARRSPNFNKTYGYHRAGILAAGINAASLILIALYIFYEGVQRLFKPEHVDGLTITVVALVALLVNSAIALALWRSSRNDLNVKSAFIHILGDALASIGVILAGIGTLLTGWSFLDPVISMLIGVFILWSSWNIIKESTNVLLEGTPYGLNVEDLRRDILSISAVKSIHDLHVWTIGSNFPALSCHILTENTTLQEANATIQAIKVMLTERYNIRHATLELECESCELPEPLHCTIALRQE